MKHGRPLAGKEIDINTKCKIWALRGIKSYRAIGREFGVSHTTIRRIMKDNPQLLWESSST